MGVVQVPQRPRTQLPPGQTGQVKPPFSLADRSGEQQLFGTVTSVAGGILQKTIQAQENEQVSTFEGSYDTEVTKFNGLIRANPGASEQQVQKWMQEANSNIGRAGAVPTNRNARRRVRNTIRQNLPAFQAQMSANWSAIESKRMLDIFNADIELAVQNLDKPKVESLATKAGGNLMDEELVESFIKLKHLRIDKLAEVAARQAQAEIDRQLIDGQVRYIDGLPHKDRKAALGSLDKWERPARSEIEARVEYQMGLEMEAVELSARELLIGDDPDISGAKAIINANLDNFGTDWHTDALNKVQNAASVLAKEGVNPYTTTTNWQVYDKDEKLALDGKLDDKTISRHTGSDGYSDTEARRLRAIIKDPVGQSDTILKDALAEVEAVADLKRAEIANFEDKTKDERATIRGSRATILRDANEVKYQLRQIKIQNPDITPDQYHNRIDAILQPVKDDGAKDVTDSMWKSFIKRLRNPSFDTVTQFDPFSIPVVSTVTTRTPEQKRAKRNKLQAVFEKLTDEQKQAVQKPKQSTFRVRNKEGIAGTVPAKDIEEALISGFTLIE